MKRLIEQQSHVMDEVSALKKEIDCLNTSQISKHKRRTSGSDLRSVCHIDDVR